MPLNQCKGSVVAMNRRQAAVCLLRTWWGWEGGRSAWSSGARRGFMREVRSNGGLGPAGSLPLLAVFAAYCTKELLREVTFS